MDSAVYDDSRYGSVSQDKYCFTEILTVIENADSHRLSALKFGFRLSVRTHPSVVKEWFDSTNPSTQIAQITSLLM